MTNIKKINVQGQDYGIEVLVDGTLSSSSTNPIQNKTVTEEINKINEKDYVLDSPEDNNFYIRKNSSWVKIMSKENVSENIKEIQPNIFYQFGEIETLTITLAEEIPNIYNEYMFQFTSGATSTTLNLPESIKWIGSNTIEPNKIYQVSIVNNLAVMGGA